MLKRVPREEVRLGMFIHSLEGSWLDHPFWRTRFLLTEAADLEAIRSSNVPAVLVDQEKSIGGPEPCALPEEPIAPEAPVPAKEAPSPVRTELRKAAPPIVASPQAPPPPQPCSAGEEVDRALHTIERSTHVVVHLLNQARLGKAVDIAKVIPVVEDITASLDRNPSALISVSRVRAKDKYTYIHSIAVCALMVNLGRQLGLDEATVRELGIAGLLHDFGKVAVPDAVLKKPGELSDLEFAIVKQHAGRGYQVLRAGGGYSEIVLDVCLHHHERVDGSGYPHGLKGDEISLYARMAAVCDVYDAITSRRPYKEARGPAESLASMFQGQGHFDDDILAAFIKSIGIYPAGSLVRLQSGMLGLVVDQSLGGTTRPIVRIFYCIKTRRRIPAYDLDLSRTGDDAIVAREDPLKWGFASWESQWMSLIRGAPAVGTRAA